MHPPKLLILSLIIIMIPALAWANTFIDDDDSVHEGNIEAIAAAGITKGCNPPENDKYCPGALVTRGEMAAFLDRALKLPSTDKDYFNDDDGHLFEGNINRLAHAGITKGCNPPENDMFCPDGVVTRGAMAAFLARALSLPNSHVDAFKDDDGHIFEHDIQRIAAEGITKGCNPPTNDMFCPNDGTSREAMASFLARAFGLKAPPTADDPVIIVDGEITGDACPCTVTGAVELKGVVDLKGDLMVEGGTLVARAGVKVNGNGHQIMVMDGGVLDWRGTPKSGWVEWGESVTGWNSGDRLAVAPLAKGDFEVHYDTWTGSWGDVSPSKATLSGGTEVRAEVANLDRDIVIDNVSRIMFHMGAGKQTIKYVAVRNAGVAGELGFYPIHFHLNYDTVRGSLLEGVVVENGEFRAFVPHGSNGVVFRDVAAVNTFEEAYWWDKPTTDDASNNSDDILWEHILALGVTEPGTRGGGIQLGAGIGNVCVDCHAAAVRGGKATAGFIWPEFRGGQVPTEGLWLFENGVAHNNDDDGIFVWQNTLREHVVSDTLLYRNDDSGIEHGAYNNTYLYENMEIWENGDQAVHLHANSKGSDGVGYPLEFVDINTDGILWVTSHKKSSIVPVEHVRVTYSGVVFHEDLDDESSWQRFTDCGLTPDDFTMLKIHAETRIEIVENGLLIYEWANGAWSTK